MIQSADLLDVARLLADASSSISPSDGQLRRAISTAYYALFHKVLDTAATRFMGPGSRTQVGFALLYRGFSHGRMKAVCRSIDVAQLSPTISRQLGTTHVSGDMRGFASAFVVLQQARQAADYDPHWLLVHADAIAFVDQAQSAMQAFDSAPPTEQADVLALMLVSPRD